MFNQTATLSIVFFDICEYSEMDVEKQINCIQAIESAIQISLDDGQQPPIAEGGDSFSLGFNTPQEAVEFAVRLTRRLKASVDFDIRTGIYTGQVVIHQSINRTLNLVGIGVDFAAHLASYCTPGQLLVAADTLDSIDLRNSSLNEYIHGRGRYKVKQNIELDIYNLYSKTEEFGVPELPLKGKVGDSSLIIIVGDRRENPARTIGDLFHAAPSIDDLCHLFRFGWTDDVILRGDKIMCWAGNGQSESASTLKSRNLLVIGSPKVNIAALMINSGAIFRFRLGEDIDYSTIRDAQVRFSDSPPSDREFENWRKTNREILLRGYPDKLSLLAIEDALNTNTSCVKTEANTYGLISFAKHPVSDNDERYAIFIAGIDLCATLTVTGKFFDLDFSQRPFGGVVKINRVRRRQWRWFEEPHFGELDPDPEEYWVTPPYSADALLARLNGNRRELIERLSADGNTLTMAKIQDLFKR